MHGLKFYFNDKFRKKISYSIIIHYPIKLIILSNVGRRKRIQVNDDISCHCEIKIKPHSHIIDTTCSLVLHDISGIPDDNLLPWSLFFIDIPISFKTRATEGLIIPKYLNSVKFHFNNLITSPQLSWILKFHIINSYKFFFLHSNSFVLYSHVHRLLASTTFSELLNCTCCEYKNK